MQRSASKLILRSLISRASRPVAARCLISQIDRNVTAPASKLSFQQLRFYTDKSSAPHFEKELRSDFTVPTAQELKSLVESDKVFLFDVREPHEVANGRVPAKRYLNLPIGQVVASGRLTPEEFKKKYGVEKPAKDSDEVVIMCLAGIRSTWALQAIHEQGYKNARHFPGGWAEWNKTFPGENV